MRYLLYFPILTVKLLLTILVYSSAILGIWLVTSLVAYINGPIWLSFLSGVLLLPLMPLVWKLKASWKPRQKNQQIPHILTFGQTLRILTLNLIFIGLLLGLYPQTTFIALSARGDWMLDSLKGSQVELVRQNLFRMANTLEGLYLAFHNNPYKQSANNFLEKGLNSRKLLQIFPFKLQASPQPTPPKQNSGLWPWEGSTLHPAVANMPSNVEVSIESVAKYIAEKESDPFLRIKALHDYVADRITYDTAAYFRQIPRPRQDAETVFKTRKAVCAGYANLLKALGDAIAEEIVYVVGDSRSQGDDINGGGHAWNAAKIKGNWYLIDSTWDSGYFENDKYIKKYSTDYLFPPPKVLIITHFPDDPAWQLLPSPLSRGDFLRQPTIKPRFFAQGMKLLSPTRSQTNVGETAIIEVENPQQRWLMATFAKKGSRKFADCTPEPTTTGQISCPLPDEAGSYEVTLFSNSKQYGEYISVGQFEFNKK